MASATSKKIYYCAVVRKDTILAEYTETKGSAYREFTQGLLKKIKVGRHMLEFQK